MVGVDKEAQEALCLKLRAFIGEWGAEFVRLQVPRSWRRFGVTKAGRVTLEFGEENRVVLVVSHPDFSYSYEASCGAS